jgi:hypothetical protein
MIWGDLAELEPRASLEWVRGALPAECERAGVVREGVETYLGRAVFAPDGAVVVRVSLERIEEAGGVRVVARVSQRDASGKSWGERSVSGSDCASLDEPLTLVVALLLDRPVVEPEPAPEPAPPEPAALPEPPRGPIETAPSLEQELVSPGHAVVLGFGSVSLGVLPRIAGGFGLSLSLKPRGFWGLGLEGELLPPVQEQLGAGVLTTSLVVLRANLCPLQGADDDTWWSACASMGVARLSVATQQLIDARQRQEWLALPGVSVRAGWRWGRRWMLVGGLVGVVPVSVNNYTYRDAQGEKQPAFTMNQLGLSMNAGLGALFE